MRYLTIVFLLLMVGCGTRKRDAYVSTIQKDVVLIENKDITTNTKTTKTATSVIYTPIDPTKEMVLPDGRKSTNAKIEEKETQEDWSVGITDKSQLELKDNSKGKEKAINLDVEKPNPYKWVGLWVALIVIICFAIYFYPRWSGIFTKK